MEQHSLSKAELLRYNRHLRLPEIGLEGQEKLKQAKVLVIGAGGLGCPVLQYLTAAGVGKIGIVDADVVDASNLHRQILYNETEVGQKKAEVAKVKLQLQNPHVEIQTYPFLLDSQNALEVLKGYDLVVDGSDNFPTRYLVNDACVLTGIPLVFGAIYKFEGQVSVFNYQGGPTYRCLFPEPPEKGSVPNCSEVGVLGVLPGLIGTYQANEAIKIILGIGEVLSGKFLTLDTLGMLRHMIRFSRVESEAKVTELVDYEAFCGGPDIEEPTPESISVEELAQWQATNRKFRILDVREDYEYEICNLEGDHIPLGDLVDQADKVSREETTVVVCHHGMRSTAAIAMLKDRFGHQNLINLEGGIHAWASRIDTEMATY